MLDTSQFIGTENWHKFNVFSDSLLTDGTLYVADTMECFWLFDEIESFCMEARNNKYDDFIVSTVTKDGDGAKITFDNGNGTEFYSRSIPFTDLKFEELPNKKLVIWSKDEMNRWIHMLPSEY